MIRIVKKPRVDSALVWSGKNIDEFITDFPACDFWIGLSKNRLEVECESQKQTYTLSVGDVLARNNSDGTFSFINRVDFLVNYAILPEDAQQSAQSTAPSDECSNVENE